MRIILVITANLKKGIPSDTYRGMENRGSNSIQTHRINALMVQWRSHHTQVAIEWINNLHMHANSNAFWMVIQILNLSFKSITLTDIVCIHSEDKVSSRFFD